MVHPAPGVAKASAAASPLQRIPVVPPLAWKYCNEPDPGLAVVGEGDTTVESVLRSSVTGVDGVVVPTVGAELPPFSCVVFEGPLDEVSTLTGGTALTVVGAVAGATAVVVATGRAAMVTRVPGPEELSEACSAVFATRSATSLADNAPSASSVTWPPTTDTALHASTMDATVPRSHTAMNANRFFISASVSRFFKDGTKLSSS